MPRIEPTAPAVLIERKIYLIRGHKVMLDRDLAALYRVKAIALRQQVKRNPKRFPEDFLFQLTRKEAELLVSQNVIPSRRSLGGSLPFAFTEQGVAMLSSVLKSNRAAEVNVAIMRVFVRIRTLLASHADLIRRLDALEKTSAERFRIVFEVIEQLIASEPVRPRNRIGFAHKVDRGAPNRRQLTSTRPRSSPP
ncbi:MAG: ORF6N domain-containing protein [Acidobacteria bacterium]|nr:ORF6N domain-containing protein [Acidobacteriota bacterium]